MRSANFLGRRIVAVQVVMAALALAGANGCGSKAASSSGSDGKATDDSTPTDDVATGELPGHDAMAVDTSKVSSTVLSPVVKVNDQGQSYDSAIKAAFIKPLDCTASAPCPLVIVVGDYDPAPYPTYTDPAKKLAAIAHANVLLFNLPGTGDGAQHSSGTNDYGGLWHMTAVQQLYKTQSIAPGVDKTKVGFLTIGTGLIPVTAAFDAFPSDLASVNFVIDVEGPIDRCSISQAPEDDTKNIGPGDGAGASDSACHFTTAPHSAQYPPATGGKPASIICAPGAWPITATGSGCDDNAWWIDREPYTKLQKVGARYQRLQFKYDHRLPSHWASRLALKAMASSASNYFALNNMPACSTVNEDDCTALEAGGQSCWLSGDYGNGLASAPYAGTDFVAISWDALFSEVLPTYVNAILDTKTNPKCK